VDVLARSKTKSAIHTSSLQNYGIAVGSIAVTLGVYLLLDSLFVRDTLLLLGLGATLLSSSIMLSAWFGGLGPGLLATALCALISDYLFLYPRHSFSDLSVESIPLVAFVLEGTFVSTLAVALRFARGRIKESAREALSNRKRYQAVVEQAAEGILLVDIGTRRVLDSNVAYQGLLGYSHEELSYLTLYDLVPYSREDTDSYIECLLDQGRHVSDGWRHRHKDGYPIDVEVSANVILEGDREIGCMVVRDVTERKRTEYELQSLNQELAGRERELHSLVRRMSAIQEEERRRVAYEVHDGFTQMAAAAYRRLQTFAEHRRPRTEDDREALEDAIRLVGRTVEEARSVIENLRPTTLDDFGLATAIRMQLEEFENEGFETSYEGALGEERLPPTLEINLFRVAQEALSNARKHARTDRVRVAIRCHDGIVRLEVRDWGEGFRTTEERGIGGPGETVGLSSMRDRVALLNGSLDIRSEPGLGTSVVAEIPLPVAGEGKEEADDEG
jgi:PAS domain S-box-containing protein